MQHQASFLAEQVSEFYVETRWITDPWTWTDRILYGSSQLQVHTYAKLGENLVKLQSDLLEMLHGLTAAQASEFWQQQAHVPASLTATNCNAFRTHGKWRRDRQRNWAD